MAKYTQANRPLSVATPLGEDALLLVGLQGHEGMSQLFSFRLDVLAPGSPVAFDRLLGQPATVRLDAPGSAKRAVNGILARVTQQSKVYARQADASFLRYRLELVPKLWLLTRRSHTRILQHLSVPDILSLVLHDEWGLDVAFRIQGQFDRRVRCVQYRETDFAFVSRLMEEEGIHYYFEHSDGGHKMVVSDHVSAPPALPGGAALLFDEMAGGRRDEARVSTWEKTQELRPCKYTLWDHCFELPGAHLEAVEHMQDAAAVGAVRHRLDLQVRANGQEMLEVYDYPGGYSHRFDGIDRNGAEHPDEVKKIFQDNQRTAKIRMQQEATQALTVEGASNVGHLAPGYQFTLGRHFDGDGPYRLTRVEHEARLEGTYLTGEHDEFRYDNRFRCVPVSVPYRPPSVTPRPTVSGTQTATVVGPKGTEIHCDKYGRVKVQFPWDRTDYDKAQGGKHVLHDSSCWVRVSQAWAGKGFGAIHIPRVGQEVIVDFLEGDPDKPIIVGCVYNAEQTPPYTLPQHRTHAGLKTHSRFGDAGEYSHLTFEDYRDREHVHLHSEQDMTHSAEQHLVQNVGGTHLLNVSAAAARQVGGLPGVDYARWIGKGATGGTNGGTGGTGGTNGGGSGGGTGGTNGGGGSGGGTGGTNGGSGGGSGGASGSSGSTGTTDSGDDSSGPFFNVSPGQAVGSWASDMDTVFGWRTGNTVGLYTTLKVGCNISTTINPFALDDFLPSAAVVAGILTGGMSLLAGGLLRNTLGVANVIIGTNTSIHYGRKLDAHCGPEFKDRHQTDNVIYAATIPAGILYNLAVIGELFVPMIPVDTSKLAKAAGITMAVGDSLFSLTMLNVWASAETDCQGMALWPKLGESAVGGALITLKDTLAEKWAAWRAEEEEEDEAPEVHGPAAGTSNETVSTDTGYTVLAPVLALVSSPSPAFNAEDPVGILIQANGLEGTDGEVLVYGTGTATVCGGDQASVQCVTEEEVTGKVTIDCGPVGTIALQSGLAQEPNVVLLSPEGISITSLLQIEAMVEENSITMNPAMITLASGPSSIAITPEGITISCGPATIAITPEGVTISGPTISIAGDAAVTIA